jgi:hypothetical protein
MSAATHACLLLHCRNRGTIRRRDEGDDDASITLLHCTFAPFALQS